MSDLGNDAGQSALGLGAKIIEALLRLLDKLYQAYLDKGKRELTQEQLSALKNDAERKQALENLNGKTGLVNYEELKKSGVPLSSFGVYMTEKEMQSFAAQCKREGILISGMTDSTQISDKGEVQYEICCKTEDLSAILKISERLTQEQRISNLNRAEAEILAKGEENLTDTDRAQLDSIRTEREQIQRGFCRDMNAESAQGVIDKAVGEIERNPVTLDKALDHYTGGEIDKKQSFAIVADASDPTKYIRCQGETAEFHGKEYTKTTYEVCHGDDVLMTTHDGRFEGRPQGYWQQQKEAMQEAGQFSGTFFKFYSEDEYREWAQELSKQNEQELGFMGNGRDKDLDAVISELNGQLEERGAQMVDGVVCDKETKKPIEYSADMSPEQKSNTAELLIIGKQIQNYQELKGLQAELAISQAELLSAEQGTPAYTAAEATVSEIQSKISVLHEAEQSLDVERRSINAAQVEQQVSDRTEELTYSAEDKEKIDGLESHVRTEETALQDMIDKYADAMQSGEVGKTPALLADIQKQSDKVADLKEELSQMRTDSAVKHYQKPDERREEQIAEKDEKQMSLEEVKGQIADRRANEGAKANDTKDRLVQQEQGAKAAVSKTAKPHER